LRILERNYKKGIARVMPKTLDDLWHLYNIILKGDKVFAQTTREIKANSEYSRPQKGRRVSVFLGINVENVVWDRSLNRLRIRGAIRKAPEDIAGRGSYHTLSISVNRPVTIIKENWEKHQTDRLERASRGKDPPVVVLSVDSEEFCIATIRQYGIDTQLEGKARLPGKFEAEKRAEALQVYFKSILKTLKEVADRGNFPILIIGAGLTKNQLAKYMHAEDPAIGKTIIAVKGVNNSGIAGINEALRSGVLDTAFHHIRIAEESRKVEEVLRRLGKNEGRVAYGSESVEKANSFGAIETLLVADQLVRSSSAADRLILEKMMREVEKKRGKVMMISVEYEAGQKLLSLGGIAALLRFPIG
jgi:protein pelota